MTPLRDRLVIDTLDDALQPYCANHMERREIARAVTRALGMNPLAETIGDVEAGRALLVWLRSEHAVSAEPRYIRADDVDTFDIGLSVYPPDAARAIEKRDTSARHVVLAIADELAAR